MNYILALLFSLLTQAYTEDFWADPVDTSTELFANPEDTLDSGVDGWEYDDTLPSPDTQPMTDEGVPISLAFTSPFAGQRVIPKEGKIDLCWIPFIQKAYCCDGQLLPDGVMSGCIECMSLVKISEDANNSRR